MTQGCSVAAGRFHDETTIKPSPVVRCVPKSNQVQRLATPPIHRVAFAWRLSMARIVAGVLFIAFSLALVGCGSSKPMRFQFKVPSGQAQIEIDEGSVYRGSTTEVYTLKSNDAEKTIELT